MSSGSTSRIHALLLRYLYVLRSSWPRIIEISYWPTMQLIIWGFVSLHFGAAQPEISASGILISVVLVWDSLFRSHVSYTLSFLEEMWSRNLGNLFVAPLRPWELMLASCDHKYDSNLNWNDTRRVISHSFFWRLCF
jgi:ABC-2 type transport system permease protein